MSGLAKGLTEDQVLRRVVEKVCEQVWSQDEALKLALEALETAEIDGNCEYGATEIIRKTLSQPEQRTWVGLTDEDIALIDWESLVTKKDCVQTIEAKLKEKNT
jgi:hypothetical protein